MLCLALAFVYAGVLTKLRKDWWTDENYSHGPLVPFVVGLIVWLEFDFLKSIERRPHVLFGGILAVGALLMLLAGTLGAELFILRASLLAMLAGKEKPPATAGGSDS